MDYVEILVALFEENRNAKNAISMDKYMRNQFPFIGMKTPKRRELMRQFYQETEILKEPLQPDFVLALWKKDEREFQNAALDYLDRMNKKLSKEHLPLMETLITTKSWWDTVDTLATKSVGKIAKEQPEVVAETIEGWAYCDVLWLQRTAILFQLKYKEHTDEKLLYRYILHHATSNEFFIQKAIGWALREYSKTNPESVKYFIRNNELAKLSIREGMKHIRH
ncbi:DNA alkylation repair protein [Oceanobacillus bengalensis]|uniref:DNA alkylation repair protein n=1 Tax=Oceanobacillus bengalensis TaxID=1435466 RepID=A0A494YSS0_9BACI|nr:DNA alkylation repair protein [Oceanobacillus bengalensis]RKQ13164.1 DNA alkylation repair protein [Oceanobacillus bengalensis]